MGRDLLKKKIRILVWDYLIDEFEKICKEIIPKSDNKYLPVEKTSNTLSIYIFILERFLNNKIIPIRYDIKYSKIYSELALGPEHKKSLAFIKEFLKSGNAAINSYSRGFIPNSSKKYFTQDGSPIVDFSGTIWGIKHLHLNPSAKDDTLLFYVVVKNIFYFLKIGNHSDLYSKSILETIVNDFPDILPHLGIYPYPDMPMPRVAHNYPIEEVKSIWLGGGNISYTINDKYYTSINLQSTSKVQVKNINLIRQISFQIENYIEQFLNDVVTDADYQNISLRIVNDNKMSPGTFLLADEFRKSAIILEFKVLKKLYYANVIKSTVSEQ